MDKGSSGSGKSGSSATSGPVAKEDGVAGWELKKLKPKDILVDHRYQRPLDGSHVKRLAAEYDVDLFGLGHVSLRDDGHYYATDSQHRCAAAVDSGHGEEPALFRVYRGLSLDEEAALYVALNGGKKAMSAIAMFNARVVAKDEVPCSIVKMLDSFGLKVAGYRRDGGISAVTALLRVYLGKPTSCRKPLVKANLEIQEGHLLSRTLHILTTAWRKDRDAFDGTLLDGVGGLLNKHGASVESSSLARSLAKSGTAAQALGKIRTLGSASGKSLALASVDWLENTYNRGRGSRGARLGEAS